MSAINWTVEFILIADAGGAICVVEMKIFKIQFSDCMFD
jgi:hypothetical protein